MLDHFSPTHGPHFSPISLTSGHDDEQDSHQSQSTTKETQEMVALRPPRQLFGVKLCGDNADWNVTPSFIRTDCQTQSVHYFHSYAVRDRIDLSSLSDIQLTNQPTTSEVVSKLLPTIHEESLIHDNFAVLLARMLCSNMKYFQWTFAGCIDWHITHRHSAEMSTKSEVVSG